MQEFLLALPVLPASLGAHGCARGRAAASRGNPVVSVQGRLTLNPVTHIDALRAILMPRPRPLGDGGSVTPGGGGSVAEDRRHAGSMTGGA